MDYKNGTFLNAMVQVWRQIYLLKQRRKSKLKIKAQNQLVLHSVYFVMSNTRCLSKVIFHIWYVSYQFITRLLSIASESYLISLIILDWKTKKKLLSLFWPVSCWNIWQFPMLTNDKTGADGGVMFTSLLF